MAAFAHTTTLDSTHAIETGGNKNLAVLTGTVDVTNYNSTNVAVTGVSNAFKSLLDVQLSLSDNGYLGLWTGTSIKCFLLPTSAGPATELTDDVDAGAFSFMAVGIAK